MNALTLSVVMLFHPSDAFTILKREHSHMKVWPATLIFVIMAVLRILSIAFTHEPLDAVQMKDANLPLELVALLLPQLTWVVSVFGITSFMSGETKLKEIYLTTAFCFVPYILITPIQILLSQGLTREEGGFYTAIGCFMYVWIILLLVASVWLMNNYTLRKTLFVCLISIIGVFLIWLVLLLCFSFIMQIVLFIKELLVEGGVLYD